LKAAIALTLTLLPIITGFGVDLVSWISATEHSHNPIILSLVLSEDFETARRALIALGQRHDSYMEDIIGALFDQYSRQLVGESYLEYLLEGVLKIKEPAHMLRWLEENEKVLDRLLSDLEFFDSPYLKASLITLMTRGRLEDRRGNLMKGAHLIVERMIENRGFLEPGETREVLAFFQAAAEIGGKDFLEISLRIVEESRQSLVIREGRSVLAFLRDGNR
jgi:hypothetical protein